LEGGLRVWRGLRSDRGLRRAVDSRKSERSKGEIRREKQGGGGPFRDSMGPYLPSMGVRQVLPGWVQIVLCERRH